MIERIYKEITREELRHGDFYAHENNLSPVKNCHYLRLVQTTNKDITEAQEPELIPWTAEDVPMPICWVRKKEYISCMNRVVIGKQSNGVLVFYRFNEITVIEWDYLLAAYEHSTDGKTWKPCGKIKVE